MKLYLNETALSTVSYAALSVGLTLCWAAFPDYASAQEVQLDPVVVTGQSGDQVYNDYNQPTLSSPKQTAPLLDTPQTVTVIPEAVIREQGARNLTEALRNTPGITFNAGENGFGTGTENFSLRGFDASGSIYYDGVRSNGVINRDIFNVERVEVFKGPSADNGRGGPGGYVNIVTKTPTLQTFFAGGVSLGFDQYNSEARKRGTFDVNYVINPTTAFRLNAVLEDSGVAGRDMGEMNPRGLTPSLAFGLGTDTRAIFSYEMLRRRDRPEWGVPGAMIPGTFRYDPRTAGMRRDAFFGLRSDFDDADSDTLTGRIEYDISPSITLSNQLRWSRVARTARFTAPTGINAAATEATTATWFYDRTTTNLTNLTNLSAKFDTGGVKHNVSAGVEVSREVSEAGRFGAAVPLAGNASLFYPDPDRVGAAPFNATQNNEIRINTTAAYVYNTMEFSKHWQLTGGVRAERYSVDIDSRTAAGLPAGLGNFQEDRTTLGGKIGLVYKPVEEGSIYAAFGVSHQPPGSYLSNPDISRTGDNAFPGLIPGADPVRALNYEVGVKWDFFNKRLSTTAALFHTDSRTPISGCTPDGSPPPGACAGPEELKGYGHQIAQGIELGVAGNVTDQWRVFGGLLLMKTERKHSAALDAARMAANPGDYPVGFRDGTRGDELAFSPKVMANLWTTYRFLNGLTIGGGVQYVGESWLGRPNDAIRIIPNGAFGKLPDYTLLHLMASYEIRKDVEVRVNVDNVTDRFYAVSTNWNGTRATLGSPRTYRISTSFKF